ncbi:MAG: aminotransferase class I/II-fold pyridoxal phosphate-dependent enzyme [Thaumarchaeota archaeon]|nr:aminotransferase class I/II-fold pyridoxal phosphate-dependent enzyme [Nitrososphaerota archaeon]
MKPRFNFARNRLGKIRKADLYRSLVRNRVSGPYIHVGKKKLVNLSSNDYLGFGVVRVSRSQTQSSSRLVAGNDSVFEKLESRLARHKSQQASLVFPTGYMANLGIISILPQKGDVILSDELNHASIIDSCKLSHAKKMVYKHNDMSDLENKMTRKGRRKFVITEGIFSMNGDFSKLKEITEICKRHDAILILDDAHGDFVAGPDGRGSGAHHGVASKIDVYVSSLSKGLGAFGGYAASKKEVMNLAVNTSRPFIYTSALPNFLVQDALEKMSSDREQKRIRLWKNIEQMRRGLESCGYIIDSQSQIIPVIIGEEKKAVDFGRYLFDNGIFAQPIRYPTVGMGMARIRISVTAWLTGGNIARSLDVFEKAGKKFDIT